MEPSSPNQIYQKSETQITENFIFQLKIFLNWRLK